MIARPGLNSGPAEARFLSLTAASSDTSQSSSRKSSGLSPHRSRNKEIEKELDWAWKAGYGEHSPVPPMHTPWEHPRKQKIVSGKNRFSPGSNGHRSDLRHLDCVNFRRGGCKCQVGKSKTRWNMRGVLRQVRYRFRARGLQE